MIRWYDARYLRLTCLSYGLEVPRGTYAPGADAFDPWAGGRRG